MRTKPKERFYQRLLRWIHRCPQCRENSLLLGVSMGTSHICRSCRHRFVLSEMTQVWEADDKETHEHSTPTDALLAA